MSWKYCNQEWKCRSAVHTGKHTETHTHTHKWRRLVCFPVVALLPCWYEGGWLGVEGVVEVVIPRSARSVIGLSVFVYPRWNVMKQPALWSSINVTTICVIIWEPGTTSHPAYWGKRQKTWLTLYGVGRRRMQAEVCDWVNVEETNHKRNNVASANIVAV